MIKKSLYNIQVLHIKIIAKIFLVIAFLQAHNLIAQSNEYFFSNNIKIIVSDFNEKVENMMVEVGVPGLSLAIIDNNQLVFQNAYGYKDIGKKRKVNKNTVFEACSLSKSFLTLVAYKLVDEGKLDLDKPIYEYLEYESLKHDSRYKMITSRMILSHSSGIENWKSYNNPDILEIIKNPGEAFTYSGEGFNYLAEVIQILLNKSYENYIKDKVLVPLELNRTFTQYDTKLLWSSPFNYATGHSSSGRKFDKWKNRNALPAAGIHTTAENYARLIISIFNRANLSEKLVEEIIKPVVKTSGDNFPFYFGLGFEVLYNGKETFVAHSGSNDGFKAMMFYSIDRKIGLVFLTNSDLGESIAKELLELSLSLDMGFYLNTMDIPQYPSEALRILKTYRSGGLEEMFKEIEEFKVANPVETEVKILNELAWLVFDDDRNLTKKIIEENLKIEPKSPETNYILGQVYLENNEYKNAYDNLIKAQELGFDKYGIDEDIKSCKRKFTEM